jgi:mono/diheme cytochrome c family protein
MVIAAAAFWVVLGATVIFVAMRGGPRGAREALHTESHQGRRVRHVLIAAVCAFGIAVPATVAALNSAHKSRVGPAGLKLTAAEAHGRELFAAKCSTCHTLGGANAVGRVGPNLDVLHPPVALITDAIAHGRARGQGQMPALLYEAGDARDVAQFVAAVAGH